MSLKKYKAVVWKDNRRLETSIEASDFFAAKDLLAAQFPGCEVDNPIEVDNETKSYVSTNESDNSTPSNSGCLGVLIVIAGIAIFASRDLPRIDKKSEHSNTTPDSELSTAGSDKNLNIFESDAKASYKVSRNKHGLTLQSNKNVFYLGKDCDASSPQYGSGSWSWNDISLVVSVGEYIETFPSISDPLKNGACKE